MRRPVRPARQYANGAYKRPCITNGSGEDFLYFHREMVITYRALMDAAGQPPITWVEIPQPGDRRPGNEVPRQTKYHLPMEILYTLVPFLIIGVLFFYTVKAQNGVNAKVESPDHTVNVVGQKWSWTFNYMEQDNPAIGATVHEVGTIEKIPDLYLPVGKSVRFNLTSADVIHSFWVPAFYFKLDVIPGHPNSFDLTPTEEGVFDGKCAELCGTYHAAMLFTVHVVSEEEYNAYVKGLASKGQTGELTGPANPSALPSTAPKEEEK